MIDFIILAGGSAGHVYPATRLLKQFHKESYDPHALFVTDTRGRPFIGVVDHSNVIELPTLPYRGISSLFNPMFWWCILKSSFIAVKTIRQTHCKCLISFGGAIAIPWILIGRILNKKIILHEQNAALGKANHFLCRWSDRIYGAFELTQTSKDITHKYKALGFPLNQNMKLPERVEAMQKFLLDQNKKTLLIFGGSQGAENLNQCVNDFVKEYGLQWSETWQCLHLVGPGHPLGEPNNYFTHLQLSHLDHMEWAYTVADLVISRAGAGSVHELAFYKIPSVLVPYPHAASHQELNASQVMKSGNFDMIKDNVLSSARINEVLEVFDRFGKLKVNEDAINEPMRYDLGSKKLAELAIELINE